MIQEIWTRICGTQCVLGTEKTFQVFRFLQQCECSYQFWDVTRHHWVFGSSCLQTTQWHCVTSHKDQKWHSFPSQYFHMLCWCRSAHILMKISIQVNTRPLLWQNVSSDSVILCKPSGEKLPISLRRRRRTMTTATTTTCCMHNLSILTGHITNNREEFWKFATNTLVMNMSEQSTTTNSEILSLTLSLTHPVFQAYTCGIDQFHCKEWQKQASSVTELSVRIPVLD